MIESLPQRNVMTWPCHKHLAVRSIFVPSTINLKHRSSMNHVVYSKRASRVCMASEASLKDEREITGMSPFLDSLKWDSKDLVVAIAQHIDTGEILMQAFADRNAVSETLQTGLATFYSRSRGGRWCKGETSGHFIKVHSVHIDCDKDSLIYLSEPIGPACHTNAQTCYFTSVGLRGSASDDAKASSEIIETGTHTSREFSPLSTLHSLERVIEQRRIDNEKIKQESSTSGSESIKRKPSWTARLLSDPELLCRKVREEAGELCQTLEENEGKERAASEAADLLYHAMVLMNVQNVKLEDVEKVLRSRFGVSGVEEKASRTKS